MRANEDSQLTGNDWICPLRLTYPVLCPKIHSLKQNSLKITLTVFHLSRVIWGKRFLNNFFARPKLTVMNSSILSEIGWVQFTKHVTVQLHPGWELWLISSFCLLKVKSTGIAPFALTRMDLWVWPLLMAGYLGIIWDPSIDHLALRKSWYVA